MLLVIVAHWSGTIIRVFTVFPSHSHFKIFSSSLTFHLSVCLSLLVCRSPSPSAPLLVDLVIVSSVWHSAGLTVLKH